MPMKSQRISSSPVCRTLPVRLSPVDKKPEFTDGRPSTQRQTQLVRNITQHPTPNTSQMKKVIQRASPEEWFDGIFTAKGIATITVYSHILSDGYGDAGQLGNAVRELNYLKRKNIVQEVIPYATFDVSSEQYSNKPKKKEEEKKEEEERKANILSICPELKIENLLKQHERSGLAPHSWKPQNWELQFPVPTPPIKPIKQTRLLQIFEMGLSEKAIDRYNAINKEKIGREKKEPLYHTGVSDINNNSVENKAVGYLIPLYYTGNKYQGMSKVISILKLEYNTIRELYEYLNDAWFVKLNNSNNAEAVIKMAIQEKCPTIILQGEKLENLPSTYEGTNIHTILGRVPQDCLDCLMACIGKEGRIYAGGEGMLVQALGVSDASVSLITQDSNAYSYQQAQYIIDAKENENYYKYISDSGCANPLLLMNSEHQNTMSTQNQLARKNNFFRRYMYSRFT